MCEHDCGLREAGAHARDDTDTLTYRAYSRWRLRAAAASRRWVLGTVFSNNTAGSVNWCAVKKRPRELYARSGIRDGICAHTRDQRAMGHPRTT